MKEYTEYMDNINVDTRMHENIMNHLQEMIQEDKKAINKVHRLPPLRKFAAAAIIVALALSLATVGYAIGRMFVNRTDTGGRVELVVVPDESQVGFSSESQDEQMVNEFLYRFDSDNYIYLNSDHLIAIDEETAILINDAIKEKLFLEDGFPINALLIPCMSGAGYWFDIPENIEMPMYNAWDGNGHNIRYIWWIIDKQVLEIITFDPPIEPIFVEDYRHAVALLGLEFAIPNILGFTIDSYQWDHYPDIDDRNAIYAVFRNDNDQMVFYYVESATESTLQGEWYVTGTIEVIEVNGTTVYMQRDDHQLDDGSYWGRYMWIHNGILYCLLYSCNHNLSDDEYIDIIASMIK